MWKIILVEDEVFVREMFKEIIAWEDLGFTIIGEAGNGKEALELMAEEEPDLVISDILMPVMNGVDLLQEARERGHGSLFIMLTCLNDFEHVRQAMEYGASNYILKLSMNVQSLKDALEKINIELVKQRLKHNKTLEQQLVHVWKQVSSYYTPKSVHGIFSLLDRFQLHLLIIHHGEDPFDDYACLQKVLANSSQQVVTYSVQDLGMTVFFCWSVDKLDIDLHRLEQEYLVWYSGSVPNQAMVDTLERMVDQLHVDWAQVSMCQKKFTQTEKRQLDHEILHGFVTLEKGPLEQLIDHVCQASISNGLSMPVAKEFVINLDTMLARLVGESDNRGAYLSCRRQDELADMFKQNVLSFWAKQQADHYLHSDHPVIQTVIQYIKANYAEELSVRSLAVMVSIDENYLSALFKKETGDTLIQYIHHTRIEQAKKELKETTLSISEIAEKVGFLNDNYFIKIFKRITNSTPKAYRKQYYGGNTFIS
ncbi:response regulator transcription factor [Gracilibacillus alcaliphilus]|uniref:response regulator transcription factor n=1 Tax=Gracilibacillus alcaliphilus TaxID=1401441 RepID=UPI00195B27D5|nr:response regulator [Gracilibacillus alcaliphilus]MBM7676795.1 two-component system response regulator YesN [Gracilibacillus alcaliphilus]